MYMMTTMENSKYEELCRLCATKTTMVLAINIFENEGAIRQISKKIDNCLPVKVHQTDELPKMICENCLYKLELLCDFRERSARTEKLLLELFKELASNRPQNQTCMVSIDNELIMVQHHQLLTDQNLQNVSEIDITHLGQREGLNVNHEIILTQQHVDINSHSLDSIDLNNHALSQDHSNQAQDTTMVEASQDIQDVRFAENINLMQHQLLTDQFRLQQELQLNITDDTGNDISLQNNLKDNQNQNNSKYHHPTGKLDDCSDICDLDYEDSKIISNNLPVESSLTEISSQGSYPSKKIRYKIEQLKQEDSNSGHSLHIDERLDITDRQIYNLSVENGDSIVMLDTCSKHWFYCNLCGKSYEDKSIFEEHYEKHFYKCDICMALFTNMDILNTHRKEVHGTSTITNESKVVPRPSKKSSEQMKSENGLKTESETSEPECDTGQCEDEEEEEEIMNSIDTEDNKKKTWSPKVCKECGKAYKSNYKLAEHMRKHTGEKPYKCKSCEKAFRSKIGLAQHEAKHTGQYDFSCPTCGKGFQCKSYLMVHQRVHSNIKPYPCTTCGQNFKTKQSLLDHTNRHLGVKPYMCDVCGRGFITKALCRAHQKIHSGLDNRKYSCKICSKMFVSKSYLQTHLRIHTGEKPFKCEVCTKAFLTRVDLRIHSTLHTGEKSYVCEMCGKAFARRDALRCHRRLHTGERPYSCEICGQTFTQFTPMAIHKRLHTGERPYTCETCGKTFVSRSTMMAHAKKHLR